MGLFSDIFSSVLEAGAKNIEEKYSNMSNDELKREWNSNFKNRERRRSNIYQSPSPLEILDKEYARRFYCKTWKQLCEEYLEEQDKAEAEKQKRAADNAKFENALPENPMVKEIIDKINGLNYDVFCIVVDSDNIVCYDDSNNSIWTLRYKKFGYPDLTYDQTKVLAGYLSEHLSLNYKLNGTRLELDDAPGGMKTSW